MNSSMIRFILGHVLKIEALLMLVPCLVSIVYREEEGFVYLTVAVITGIFGILMGCKKPKDTIFYLKEGCVATSLSWIFMSFFGCLPFLLTGEIPNFTDAVFETVSGFTTTGATILDDVEALSYTSLMWRSFSHWIGGMGVLVFLLAVIPLSGGSNINLMRAESPGPSVGKLVPKIRYTAQILYAIYLVLTIVMFLFLIAGKMPLFDAVATSFSTAGTGGFGIKNNSMAGYSPYIQWIVTIFMILFGINFNAFYFLLFRQFKKAFTMEEVRSYLFIILAAGIIIFVEIADTFSNAADALRHAFFQVGSLITSTGYSTLDYDLWPETCKCVLILLMFIGACAGSTGGGIKVSRIVLLLKTIAKELNSYIHPKSIKKIKMDKKNVEHEVLRSVNVYFITFIIILAASVFLISFDGKDFTTNFVSTLAALNNIGPGMNLSGPTESFSLFSTFTKWILIFDMLAGRLELFPLLILFHPVVWKDMFARFFHKRSSL